MIILKERVKGYNNIHTLATSDMKFEVNENVNKVFSQEKDKVFSQEKEKVFSQGNEPLYLLGSAMTLGFLVT